ncbi:MAG: hypothetical protein H6741_17330 [Alphaproteobacteria bacterium]|nr:hypothetical protein [Alphaproteobacteria bacterium]MCB9794480.1 hypothetical protein [Alphaproteobacteria bacterium]
MATTQGETKLVERKEKGELVFYQVEHPDRIDGLEWLVIGKTEPAFISMEKAFEEGANVIIDVLDEDADPDLENMPTMFFGWAYIRANKTAKKNWYGRKAPTGRISFADF